MQLRHNMQVVESARATFSFAVFISMIMFLQNFRLAARKADMGNEFALHLMSAKTQRRNFAGKAVLVRCTKRFCTRPRHLLSGGALQFVCFVFFLLVFFLIIYFVNIYKQQQQHKKRHVISWRKRRKKSWKKVAALRKKINRYFNLHINSHDPPTFSEII